MHFAETGLFADSTYLAFIRAEHEEVERLKWLESERLGRDVGRDFAHFVWVMRGHRAAWISGLKSSGQYL